MTLAIFERVESRKLDVQVESPSAEFEYLVFKSTDENAVRLIVESTISSFYTDPFGGVLPFQNYTIEHQGNGIWYVTTRYSVRRQTGRTANPVAGVSNTVNFEIGTQTVKLTQSLETVHTYSTTTAPDCKGAIGVNGDNVDGVDIDKPTMTFSETWHVDPAQITTPFLVALRDLAEKPVNDAPFRGFDTGEVRFLGASGSQKDEQNFEITFKFAVSPNRDDLVVGPDLSDIEKGGWEYLWIRYTDALDNSQLVKQPSDVYVEKVYDSSSFDVLGIGA